MDRGRRQLATSKFTPSVVGALVPDLTPWGHVAPSKPEQEKMAKLFAMSPNLIAELKRCYDLIDSANASMKQVREKVLGSTLDWDDALFKEVVDVLLTLD